MPTLTPYQQWQLAKYGNVLPDGTCEIENGTLAAEDAERWMEAEAAKGLLETIN